MNISMQEKLQNRDYYVVLDKSGSMSERDTPSGQSRWDYAKESVLAIANTLQPMDPDGITLVPFSGGFKFYPNTTPDKLKDIYAENSPMGSTNLAPPLQACFDDYDKAKKANTSKANGAIIVVITDGEPADEDAAAKAIVKFGNKLTGGREEFGIQFLQVGRDAHATAFLNRLDNNLAKEGAKLDIVNTIPIDEVEKVGLTEALMGALTA